MVSEKSIEISIAAIIKDTDGDGLYDIEEKRFLTDYQNPDTDGDGLKDGEELNPLAVPLRKMDDEAQIKQAIFKIHARPRPDTEAPVLVITQEKEKQEYFGVYPTRVLCFTQQELNAFRKEAGYGVTTFFYGGMPGGPTPISDNPIDIQGDQAKLEFVEYHAPLAATGYFVILKKLHGVWVVVENKPIWVA